MRAALSHWARIAGLLENLLRTMGRSWVRAAMPRSRAARSAAVAPTCSEMPEF